jgi:hypothetical protein
LDSGGFSELSLYGGWRTTPEEYIAAVRRYDIEIRNLSFVAGMDWMCEPHILSRTGLSVIEHQRNTVENHKTLVALWQQDPNPDRVELPVMPTLQGYGSPEEYLRCWDMYGEAGIDLADYPVVGVGSICRRQATNEVGEILSAIRDRDPDVPLHLFGVKMQGIRRFGHEAASIDTMAWSFNARLNQRLPGCTHKSCSNCREYAMRWRRRIVPSLCDRDHGPECDGLQVCRFGGPQGMWSDGDHAGLLM